MANTGKSREEYEAGRIADTRTEFFGFKVDLCNVEAIACLNTAKVRTVKRKKFGGYGDCRMPQILWDGRWLDLCRTDLKDDVATGSYECSRVRQWREYYLKRIHYGVRIVPSRKGYVGRWSVVDALSDG